MQLLPPEIWLEILRWATTSDKEINQTTHSYAPFQPTPDGNPDPAIAVKTKLALVCREWRYLTTGFLYETLLVSHAISTLRDVLRDDAGYGKLVGSLALRGFQVFTNRIGSPGGASLQKYGHYAISNSVPPLY